MRSKKEDKIGLIIVILILAPLIITISVNILLKHVSDMAVYHNYLLGIIFISLYIKYCWNQKLDNPINPLDKQMFKRYKFAIIGGFLIIFWFILTYYTVLPPKIAGIYKYIINNYYFGSILIGLWFLLSIFLPFLVFIYISETDLKSTIKSLLSAYKNR